MPTRHDLVSFYLQRAEAAGFALTDEVRGAVLDLDPFVCRALLSRRNPASSERVELRWTCAFSASSTVALAEKAEPILLELGLDGLLTRPPPPAFTTRLAAARTLLSTQFPEEAKLVEVFTSNFAYLHAANGKVPFSSGTFRDLPHTTLFTALAPRHVAPATIFSQASTYALAENLAHEATHQLIYFLIDSERMFQPIVKASALPMTFIPWRQTEWSFFKVVHTALVYATCGRMRSEAYDSSNDAEERRSLAHGLEAAREACAVLIPALLACRHLLKPEAAALAEQAAAHAASVFGASGPKSGQAISL